MYRHLYGQVSYDHCDDTIIAIVGDNTETSIYSRAVLCPTDHANQTAFKVTCTLIATGDRSTGPSCWGSPAKTSCPPPGVSVLNMPARGTRHSGCREWPASSMNTCVKCWSGISPDTNLKKHATLSLFHSVSNWAGFSLQWNYEELWIPKNMSGMTSVPTNQMYDWSTRKKHTPQN